MEKQTEPDEKLESDEANGVSETPPVIESVKIKDVTKERTDELVERVMKKVLTID